MSYTGKNPVLNWLNLNPQAADPTSPNEGDLYYSDGTLRTEGLWLYTNSTWTQIGVAASVQAYRSVTTTDTATTADAVLVLSGASFTQSLFTAVGNAGRVLTIIHNGTSASQVYTIDPSGSQTIGGLTTLDLNNAGEWVQIISDNANWQIMARSRMAKEFTSSGSFTTFPGCNSLDITYVGGGGGGGAGAANGGGTATKGAGGGAGAQPVYQRVVCTPLDTLTITVGAGGAGAPGTASTSGAAGSAGGNTSIVGTGIYLYAPGASGGAGGTTTTGGAGGSTYANNNSLIGLTAVSSGGTGATTATNPGGDGTATSRVFVPASGGAAASSSNRSAAGGAGGSGMGKGGAGGAGNSSGSANAGNPGVSAAATSYGAGGGGSSGTLSVALSSAGGNGAGGYVRIEW